MANLAARSWILATRAGTYADGGDTVVGRWQLLEDDVHWADDLHITYRRRE